ncbi:MAG: hypothetical protein IPJ40_09545 [Saprospirales bacterium]|nr:hypothetical protein [Saprospirales bacterium]
MIKSLEKKRIWGNWEAEYLKFKIMKILSNPMWRKGVSFFLAILILVFTTSCNYYQVRRVKAEALPSLSEIGKIANYFVLNQGGSQFQLTQITLGEDYLKARLDSLSKPVYYSESRRGREYKYEEKSILHEVHVFLKDSTTIFTPGTDVVIPVADLEKIEVIDPDTGITVMMYFLVGLGVASAALVIALIIWVATKSSCPYVYANNGETFVMEGEIYSGAIFKGLERHDYLPLPSIQPVDNTYELRIANELKEQQHTNLANLIVVNHPEGSRVLMDQDGIPYLLMTWFPRSLFRKRAGSASANGFHRS